MVEGSTEVVVSEVKSSMIGMVREMLVEGHISTERMPRLIGLLVFLLYWVPLYESSLLIG